MRRRRQRNFEVKNGCQNIAMVDKTSDMTIYEAAQNFVFAPGDPVRVLVVDSLLRTGCQFHIFLRAG